MVSPNWRNHWASDWVRIRSLFKTESDCFVLTRFSGDSFLGDLLGDPGKPGDLGKSGDLGVCGDRGIDPESFERLLAALRDRGGLASFWQMVDCWARRSLSRVLNCYRNPQRNSVSIDWSERRIDLQR